MQVKIESTAGFPEYRPSPKPAVRKIKNLNQLLGIIESYDMSESVKKKIIKEVKTYPEGSLDFVWNNLNNMINKFTLGEMPAAPPKVEE